VARDSGRTGMMRIAPALLLALVVLVRGLVPTGWMPSPTGGPLIICSAEAPGRGHDGGQPGDPAKNAAHEICVFAAAGTAPPPGLAVDLRPAEPVAMLAPRRAATQSQALPTPRVREQSPRAPPLMV
jgi:hypothetical protein